MGCPFPKEERLKKNTEIKTVLDRSAPFRGRLVNVYLFKRPYGPSYNRAAFLIRKGLYAKKLVLRNRFKRVLRGAYRNTKEMLPKGYDVVIMAVRLKHDTKSNAVEKELYDIFKKNSKK